MNTGVGFKWNDDAAQAIKELGEADDCRVVVLVRPAHFLVNIL